MEKPLRVLIAKPGLDGHDRGAKVVAMALRDAGAEVIYTGRYQSVDNIIKSAVQEDVKVIGLSILSGAHLSYTEKLMQKLSEKKNDFKVVIGGNIPAGDEDNLFKMGVAAIFASCSTLDEIVAWFNEVANVQ